jgi:UDP-glucose 4-epimerase
MDVTVNTIAGREARREGFSAVDRADDRACFASVGASPPDGSNLERSRAFDSLGDARRIREDLGFKPKFPRLAYAIAASA